MLKLNHKKMEVYIKSKELIAKTYALSAQIPQSEMYGLVSQIRRSAISVISNIAEGASRKSAVERKRFFEISRSSVVELDTQIEVTLELGLIKDIPIYYEELITQVFSMLSKMIK